jgi:hypothetical protein
VAQTLGYQAALVPGIAVLTAAVPALVAHSGREWACRGRLETRFVRPCYDRDPLRVVVDGPAPNGVTSLQAVHTDGRVAVQATVSADPGPPADHRPPSAPQPPAALTAGASLMPLIVRVTQKDVDEYLAAIGAGPDPFAGTGILHPLVLLRTTGLALRANGLGAGPEPLIHVGSDFRLFRATPPGEVLTLAGLVSETFERRGRGYAALDLGWYDSAGAAVAASVHLTLVRSQLSSGK